MQVSDRFEGHKYTQYIEINGCVHKFNTIISTILYKILFYFSYCGILSTFHVVGFCPVGFCLVGFCLVGFCLVGFCHVGFCPVGFCPVGFCPGFVPRH